MGVGNFEEKIESKRERERERVGTKKRENNSERKEREFVRAKRCHWVAWQGIILSRKH